MEGKFVVSLSVIIVNWNAGNALYNCLLSLGEEDNAGFIDKIYVLDNNSTDGSLKRIENKFDRVIIIKNEKNLGYAKAVNKALKKNTEDYVLILNPDTEICKGSLKNMLNYMNNNPDVGMIGPKLVNSDGSFQAASKRSIPTPFVAFCRVTGLSRLFPGNEKFARYNLTFLEENKVHDVEAISGACMLARRKAIDDVGMMDEDYFMYGEDLDWCYRFGKTGWKIIYFPRAVVIHHHRVSSRKRPVLSSYSFYQAMYIFYKKHFKKKLVADWIIVGSIVAMGAFAVTRGLINKVIATRRAEKIHEKEFVN